MAQVVVDHQSISTTMPWDSVVRSWLEIRECLRVTGACVASSQSSDRVAAGLGRAASD